MPQADSAWLDLNGLSLLPIELLSHILDHLSTIDCMTAKCVSRSFCSAGRGVLPRRWPGLSGEAGFFTFDTLPTALVPIGCHGGRMRLHSDGTVSGVYAHFLLNPPVNLAALATPQRQRVQHSKIRGTWTGDALNIDLLDYCANQDGPSLASFKLRVSTSELTVQGHMLSLGGQWRLHVLQKQGDDTDHVGDLHRLNLNYSPPNRRPPQAQQRGRRTRRERAAHMPEEEEEEEEEEHPSIIDDVPSRPPPLRGGCARSWSACLCGEAETYNVWRVSREAYGSCRAPRGLQ